jgi:microcin C transport system substrate-binding protein
MRRHSNFALILALAFTLTIAASCSSPTSERPSDSVSAPVARSGPVSTNKDDYPVFPDADAGADPVVPADQGGKGFTGQGWETNTTFDLIGDPHALKGGMVREATTDFPTTLRYWGPNISIWNYYLHTLAYETLLGLHPTTLEYIPSLATHWQISPDKKTFRFRINPNARWSDGMPVVADDVLASWKLATDKGLQDPQQNVIFTQFEAPVAESKYIVSVKAKTENWQNFLSFSNSLFVYPAHALKNIDGAKYIKEWNDKMLPGSGPYALAPQDIVKGNSMTLRRRKDYWAEKHRGNVGLGNFDAIQTVVVRDRNLEFEQFKKGDLDYYIVNRASMWVEELDYENIKRGLNQKRKIFNFNPQGTQGLALNTRREPFNDIRVRKALRLLFNREGLIAKLMYNQYQPMDSFYSGSVYQNPNNEKIKYDPQMAVQLLAEAGWKDRDASGRLTKNGRPFTFELIYDDQAAERYLTPYAEDLRKVGISMNLRRITFETKLKLTDERTFDAVLGGWVEGVFPNPEAWMLSRLADEKNSQNVTGFKSAKADELIAAYNKSFDVKERIKLMQELDGLITNSNNFVLEWTAPYLRVIFWNKFGQPPGIVSRVGDYSDILKFWWIDPEKTAKLDQAIKDPSIQLGEGQSENRYWLEYAKTEEAKSASAK